MSRPVCPPWCQSGPHPPHAGARSHVLELGPFPGPEAVHAPGEIRLTVLRIDAGEEAGETRVRLAYEVDGKPRAQEMNADDAADLGDLLRALGVPGGLSACLVGVFWLTGGEL